MGQEIAQSDWVDITQERIALFAQATGDQQWIHVDADRCRRESPFGVPVAHGFLTLALIPSLMANAIRLADARLDVNYGLNKVRFPAPLKVGARVRGSFSLIDLTVIAGGQQLVWKITIEIEGGDKPACVAEAVFRRYD